MGTAAEAWVSLDHETRAQARRFHCFYVSLVILAAPLAAALYLRLRLRSPVGVRWLRRHGHGAVRTIYAIAAARLLRRALRVTGCNPAPVVFWPKNVPSSCVVAFFHSPWDPVIVRELRDRRACLIRAGTNWAGELGKQYVRSDLAGLKALVKGVAGGARCAAAADHFVVGAQNGFLGTRSVPNPAVARLSAATGAPLVTLWPAYAHGVLTFDVGTPVAASVCAERPDEALRVVGRFFEQAVRQDLQCWSRIVHFLERVLTAQLAGDD